MLQSESVRNTPFFCRLIVTRPPAPLIISTVITLKILGNSQFRSYLINYSCVFQKVVLLGVASFCRFVSSCYRSDVLPFCITFLFLCPGFLPTRCLEMGFLGLGEPSIGTFVILFGAWLNRDKTFNPPLRTWLRWQTTDDFLLDEFDLEEASRALPSRIRSPSPSRNSSWRHRDLNLLNFTITVTTPNTYPFSNTLPSRVLRKFPYIIEIIYWVLIYSVYQMGRGFLAVHLEARTVDVARSHALQVIWLERRLGIFIEQPIQAWFLQFPSAIYWVNRIYSFVHLPFTITFLVGLYWFTITRNRPFTTFQAVSSGPWLYESRRRTLAFCNLFAFLVFSTWPCMPPRLLNNTSATYGGGTTPDFGFVDTVHQYKAAVSAFNKEKWTNQLAAMPSMHFGYALLIGVSIATLPLAPRPAARQPLRLPSPVALLSRRTRSFKVVWPGWARVALVIAGSSYPLTILVAIVATANHFILDAVAGSIIVGVAWKVNGLMLNFRALEDCVFWVLRTHKPVPGEEFDGDTNMGRGGWRSAGRNGNGNRKAISL
jgi:hypothetical protein